MGKIARMHPKSVAQAWGVKAANKCGRNSGSRESPSSLSDEYSFTAARLHELAAAAERDQEARKAA